MGGEEIKADTTKVEDLVKQEVAAVKAAPPWERYVLLAVVLLILAYIGWSVFNRTPVAQPAVFTPTEPAIVAPKVPGRQFKVPPKVVPKPIVQKKYPQAVIAPQEEVLDTAKIPKAPYGGVAIVTADPDTGVTRTQFKPEAAPWLAFEQRNYLGVGYRVGTDGSKVPIYYKRDILQVKDLHLQVEGVITVPITASKTEAYVGANLEYRWDGLNPFK